MKLDHILEKKFALFSDLVDQLSWNDVGALVKERTTADVERALQKDSVLDMNDFMALISPKAEPYLEAMAQKAQKLTRRRFGRIVQLYIPLYLSNECTNQCVYCGFSAGNKIPRRTLTMPEILQEAEVIQKWGFEHLLLVTGEDVRHVDVDYLCQAVRTLRPLFAHISLEVQPLDTEEYQKLMEEGVSAVYVYQETYRKETYPNYHLKGKKRIFNWRVNTPDRLGQAGLRKVGLGCLIGLEDWRIESTWTALHLRYLEKKYWRSRYSMSFPRLRPHAGEFNPQVVLSDRELVQLILAWRLFDPDLELSLSTRESPQFREGMLGLGITNLSAASRTDPGGYAQPQVHDLEQFTVNDDRSADEIAAMINRLGFEPVWKDWDAVLEA